MNSKKAILCILFYTIVPIKGALKQSTKPVLSLGSSNFEEIVSKPDEVVDKTLFIKTILEETPNKILLTAPKYFGKSTNLDMVKRFTEMEVDDRCMLKDKFKTSNYKLFKKNNLKINREKKILNEHLGNYPVILIDYKPLKKIKSFNGFLDSLRDIIKKTFLFHQCLVKVRTLWLGEHNITTFKKYIGTETSHSVDLSYVTEGFRLLLEVLNKHYKKRVYIFIDEYDAFIESLMFKYNPDTDRIITFIRNINEFILSSSIVDRALVTGVLTLTGGGLCVLGNNLTVYEFLGDHPFSTFFGLTGTEVDVILKKFVGYEEINRTKNTIDSYYKGYKTLNSDIIYNIWSVLSFLHQEKEFSTFWCRPEYLEKYKPFFKVRHFKDLILKLLSGNSLPANISTLLSKDVLLTIRDNLLSNNNEVQSLNLVIEIFYHLGYLTIANTKKTSFSEYYLKIPNREISLELSKILTKTYIEQLKFNFQNIYYLHSAIDSIHRNAHDHKLFENLFKSIKTLYIYGVEKTIAVNEYQSTLFTFLVMEFRDTFSDGFKSKENEYKDVFIINKKNVAFFIEIKVQKDSKTESIERIAESAFNLTITQNYKLYLEPSLKREIDGKVFLGICFGLNRKLRMTYSYQFEIDDEFRSPVLIPRQ